MFAETLQHLLDVLVTLVGSRVHLLLDSLVHLHRLLLQGQPEAMKNMLIMLYHHNWV